MKAHVIENGVIINTIEVTGLDFMPNLIDASSGGKIGDSYENGVFNSPEIVPTVPNSVTSVQALTALHNAGLLPTVEAAMNDPSTDQAAVIAYKRATNFRRQSPFINALAPALGLTESQINDLFIAAAQIE